MVSSVLSPEKVIGRQNTNRVAAQNFISGGSVLGASAVNGAANKIVGFQRAGVQPASSAVGSIVSTISTNINNNVTSTINKTLQGFSADYQKRLKQVDDTKPIGILGKFLNVYKTALGFINFFGNKKNIDKVRDNLEALKKSFTESFEVAKLIRQVIIKIVKQLSNLPVASPSGGGGLNLDVDIPGGGLKKSAPRGLGRMMRGKGKMLALGAGALGLGAAGGAAVNALSDSPQAQAAETSPEIPGDIGDKFSSIVDRFANAVSKLFENKKQKPKQQQSSGSSGGGGTKASPAPGSSPSAGSMGAADVTADTKEEKAWLQTLRTAEGTAGPGGYGKVFGGKVVKELEEGKLTIEEAAKMSETGKLPDRLGGKQISYGTYGGKVSGATGAYQFMPGTLRSAASRAGIDLNTPMTPEIQDKLGLSHLRAIGIDPSKAATEATIRKAGGSAGWAGVHGEATGQTKRTVKESLAIYNQYYGKASASPSKGMGGPAVDVSMISPEARKALGIQISQPPPSQQQQQPVVMPIDLSGGGQQQSGGGGGGGGPAPSQGSGPSVPFLPAGNPDNFLVLYSRMVYNIVDG